MSDKFAKGGDAPKGGFVPFALFTPPPCQCPYCHAIFAPELELPSNIVNSLDKETFLKALQEIVARGEPIEVKFDE